MEPSDEQTMNKHGETPPYVAFHSFARAVELLRADNPAPADDVAASLTSEFPAGVLSQIMTAFRFFGFIDHDRRPSEELRTLLASAPNTEPRHRIMRDAITASYGMTEELLRHAVTVEGDVSRFVSGRSVGVTAKCRRFLLEIAISAGIPPARGLSIPSSRAANRQRSAGVRPPQSGFGSPDQIIPGGNAEERRIFFLRVHDMLTKILEFRQPPPDDRAAVYQTVRWLARLSAAD